MALWRHALPRDPCRPGAKTGRPETAALLVVVAFLLCILYCSTANCTTIDPNLRFPLLLSGAILHCPCSQSHFQSEFGLGNGDDVHAVLSTYLPIYLSTYLPIYL
eukprot:COSAG06_NODE_32650_length_502_cov_1.836228_1_plen_104_part_01